MKSKLLSNPQLVKKKPILLIPQGVFLEDMLRDPTVSASDRKWIKQYMNLKGQREKGKTRTIFQTMDDDRIGALANLYSIKARKFGKLKDGDLTFDIAIPIKTIFNTKPVLKLLQEGAFD